jgi:hypothetical protein
MDAISENQPFDFLTWFKFAPEQAVTSKQPVRRLRPTEEWTDVESD